MTAEIRKAYIEAGYQSTINLSEKEAYARFVDTKVRSMRNKNDIELEWIAMGCASAYSDIMERSKH